MEEEKKQNPHAGHKKRMRQRFFDDEDFSGFQDHEILELLLNYSIIRGNTNTVAHRLMEKYESISRVFDATAESLMAVEGVGERTAALLKLQTALFRIYSQDKFNVIHKKSDDQNMAPYIRSLFHGYTKELFYMICVDKSQRVIKTQLICEGSVDSVMVDTRRIIKTALDVNASGIIFAHNHPSGILVPSEEDIEVTKLLERALFLIGVTMIDHIIVAGGQCTSVLHDHKFQVAKYLKSRE